MPRMTRHLSPVQARLDFTPASGGTLVPPEADPPFSRSFPAEETDRLAEIESYNKHLFRPNTYLHKWWARRSGTTFRHILKQFCDDPGRQDYYAPGGLEGKIILDPMMGGGTTVHEAIRLGASVAGFDIDPIPVLQARASLQPIALDEKEAVFRQFQRRLTGRLAPLFAAACPECGAPGEAQFLLHGQRRCCACPDELVLVDSLVLREEPDGRRIALCPYTGRPHAGDPPPTPAGARRWIFEKGARTCPHCAQPFEELLNEPFSSRYRPLVVAGTCRQHGLFFKPVDAADQARIDAARAYAGQHVHLPASLLRVRPGPKSKDLLNRNIASFADVFTARQLIYIAACRELLADVAPEHRLWLGLLVSTSLELNSLLCGYKGADRRRAGAIRHVFSHHAYTFPYTALENNPVFSGNTSGTLGLLFEDRIRSAAVWAGAPVERQSQAGGWKKVVISGETDCGAPAASIDELRARPKSFWVGQQDSSRLPLPDGAVDHVVTDPPYYDSVQYSDLAQFFRAWLSWLLPGEADWHYQLTGSAVAETGRDGEKYQRVLSAIWSECRRVLKKPDGRLVFTFHHWRPAAWARLALSLKQAGFRLDTSYTIQSENPISVHIRRLSALKHDSILVLQPAEPGRPARYAPPGPLNASSSGEFCDYCAAMLGYCLESNLGDAAIIAAWQNALGMEPGSCAGIPHRAARQAAPDTFGGTP